MTIYIDENMSPFLAEGFDILQRPLSKKTGFDIQVLSIAEVFGRGVKDEDWIPQAGESSACVITQDYNINRITHQRELCELHQLGMFYFRPPSKAGLSYWDMLQLLTKHWEQIIKIARKEKRPFSYKATLKTSKGNLERM